MPLKNGTVEKKEYDREYRKKHRSRRLATNRAWKARNKERAIEIHRAANKRYRDKTKMENKIMRVYGVPMSKARTMRVEMGL